MNIDAKILADSLGEMADRIENGGPPLGTAHAAQLQDAAGLITLLDSTNQVLKRQLQETRLQVRRLQQDNEDLDG